MRLIDGDALMKELEREVELADDWKTAHEIVNVVKYFPTIESEQTIGKWVPIKSRPMDEDERKEWSAKLGHKLEDDEAVIYTSQLPEDGQDVLICLSGGHIRIDAFGEDDLGCYFDGYDLEDAIAWMPLPEPYHPDTNVGNISRSCPNCRLEKKGEE